MGCRQALVGGRYALVELQRRTLAPDFFVLLLWRQLMSPKVSAQGLHRAAASRA